MQSVAIVQAECSRREMKYNPVVQRPATLPRTDFEIFLHQGLTQMVRIVGAKWKY